MTFNEGIQIDGGGASGGGGGRGGPIAIGGGAIGIIVLVIAVLTGNTDLLNQVTSQPPAQQPGQQQGQGFSHCKTGADANKYVDCRIIATSESLNVLWAKELPRAKVQYKKPSLAIFKGSTNTGCGPATSAVGPFYCPADQTAYFDTGFFQVLVDRFGSSGGPLAQEYVVAHEYGHHIENQLGLLGKAQQDPKGPESGGVRVELMADCLAGVWAHHAANTVDPETKQTFLKPLTDKDIADALSAAASVGDDRIQQKTQGRVNPEGWTHGSAEQRQRWFSTGYKTGDFGQCDTFKAQNL